MKRRTEEAALFLHQPVATVTAADVEYDHAEAMPQAVNAEGNEFPTLARAKGILTTIGGAGGALTAIAGFFGSLHPAAQAALILGVLAIVGAAGFYIWRRIEDRKTGLR